MTIKDWRTYYPVTIDDTSLTGMPDLDNNQDLTRVSQPHAVRDAAIAIEVLVGSDAYEYGSIRYHIHDGYLMLGEITDPTSMTGRGIVYAKDILGISELNYIDDNGAVVQLTKNGYTYSTFDSVYGNQPGVTRSVAVDDYGIEFDISNVGSGTNGIYITSSTAGVESVFRVWHESDPADSSVISSYIGLQPKGGNDAISLTVESYTDTATPGDALTAGELSTSLKSKINNHATGSITSDIYSFVSELGGNGTSRTTAIYINSIVSDDWDVAFENTSGDIRFDGGPVRFGEQAADPTNVSNKGFIYSKNDDEYNTSELFYMDDSGQVTQVTQDGYLATYNSLKGVGLYEQAENPPTITNKGYLYCKDDSGDTELFYMDDSGNVVQITSNGNFNSSLDSVYDGPTGSGSGRTITVDSGAIQINASGIGALELDGYLTLNEITDPTYADNTGHLYSKDDSGYTELNYMDNYGDVTQITKDGYLNIAPAILMETTDPIPGANAGFLYSKDNDGYGYTELNYMDNYGSVTQITSNGNLAYFPTNHGDWAGADPTTVFDALNRLAAAYTASHTPVP